MRVDMSSLTPAERRMILVANDDTYDWLINRVNWKRVALAVPLLVHPLGRVIAPFLGDAVLASGYLAVTLAAAAERLKREQKQRSLLRRWFTKGEIPVPHLSVKEATKVFRFDHGLPSDGTVYVLNPCRADYYLLPAEANERLAQEKLAAFSTIAAALGAKTLHITSAESMERTGSGGVTLKEAASQIGLRADFDASGKVQRTIVAKFPKPQLAPTVPEDLQAWLDVDPILGSLARVRRDQGVLEFGVTLTFGRMIDVNAKACGQLEKRKLSVGGKYRQVGESRWSFEMEFWPAAL